MQTRSELDILTKSKMETPYQVKGGFDTETKDVDFSKRIVTGISNTFYFFDADQDVLIGGCTKKSETERGPGTSAPDKIVHALNHDLKQLPSKPQVLEERAIGGMKQQYFETKITKSTIGNDTLINYQEGVYNQHSIGFQYVDLGLLTSEDDDWTKWTAQLINPQDAEKAGYMFIVKEIKQFEWSTVAFGANKLTPYLGVKSSNKDAMALKVFERIELLERQYTHGKQSDETLCNFKLEALQLKQIITELFIQEPSIKDTLLQGRHNKDTSQSNPSMTVCPSCFKYVNLKDQEAAFAKCPSCGQFISPSATVMTAPLFDLNKAIKETKFFNS